MWIGVGEALVGWAKGFQRPGPSSRSRLSAPAVATPCCRERRRRQVTGRIARGVCTKYGADPPEDSRRQCEPSLVKDREAGRHRYDKARARGLDYGGRDPDRKSASVFSSNRERAPSPPVLQP